MRRFPGSLRDQADSFSEGLARVETDASRFGVIDRTGRLVIPDRYDEMSSDFSEGLAAVCAEQRCGYADKRETMVLPTRYAMAQPFHHGLAFVVSARGVAYIDRRGCNVWGPNPWR